LKDSGVDVIISSPFVRTVETVKPLANLLGIEIETMEELRETNHGIYTNKPSSLELEVQRKQLFGDNRDHKF
jgi:broad specificity phosphatase PhoE